MQCKTGGNGFYFFNIRTDDLTVLAISNLCYAIYTEWLDWKNNGTIRNNNFYQKQTAKSPKRLQVYWLE